VDKYGYVDPNSGSKYVEVPHGLKKLILKNQKSVRSSLKPNAGEVIKNNLGKNLTKDLFEKVEVIRTDRLQQMAEDGLIPESVMLKIYDVKPSYSFYITVQEDGREED
jgi:hypothetical protein